MDLTCFVYDQKSTNPVFSTLCNRISL